MKIVNSLQFEFKTPADAFIFYNSFMPEYDSLPMKRSSWHFSKPQIDSNLITCSIKSDDATAFRATINSLLQFAHIVEKTLNLVDSKIKFLD